MPDVVDDSDNPRELWTLEQWRAEAQRLEAACIVMGSENKRLDNRLSNLMKRHEEQGKRNKALNDKVQEYERRYVNKTT